MLSLQNHLKSNTKRISVAPMIDWTSSHYRTFARLFNPNIYLYTEMISTGAILKGDTAHHLRFFDNEPPLVLQLGGSNPTELAQCAKLGQDYGYTEINLNVGCPSDRVQFNKIGACLMAEASLVADCVKAMKDNCDLPVTVKHRIGIDNFDSYEFMRDFVGTVAETGCTHFIVHARIAILNGLSPKENREIPPLRYDDVYRLKQEFPELFIEINGGIKTLDEIKTHLNFVDGVMIGREFYHNPMLLGQCNELWGRQAPTHQEIFDKLLILLENFEKTGVPLTLVMRHYLGLFQGLAGSRKWRQALSGQKSLSLSQIEQAGRAVLAQNAG
ncbi:tRNA dihydrouridine(20/20a) synthase DusA [Moraxella nasicaprae]|uniref:tRNA-dihydrouridine(20/20a) synthase n=1 Tax=Moraxella nasicaprae TaxID=2904122 RepID=A0ABY6F387_9GAMM|nr:tRNA dihydrouridine(20/20a) synthase DusA [Moraxella nasicaprae]UXZ04566.1 tRNA dihydrouridine(20/20a) synthase DusA [Moraxella nasicaprae]